MSSISTFPTLGGSTVSGPAARRMLAALAAGWVVCLALIPLQIDRAFGLPAHPLLLHVPVIFDPLLALATLALVARRPWRERAGLLWGAFAVMALAGTILTVGAGEAFISHRPRVSPILREHRHAGETLRIVMIVFVALVLLVVLTDLLRAEGRLRGAVARVVPLLLVLTAVGAGAAGFFTVRTGHLGAKATWGGPGGGFRGGGFPGGGFRGGGFPRGGGPPGANGP
jgi:hypothetical protein